MGRKKITTKKTGLKPVNKTEVKNCSFVGVKWDADSLEALAITAQALLNITEIYKSQNISIESLLKIDR